MSPGDISSMVPRWPALITTLSNSIRLSSMTAGIRCFVPKGLMPPTRYPVRRSAVWVSAIATRFTARPDRPRRVAGLPSCWFRAKNRGTHHGIDRSMNTNTQPPLGGGLLRSCWSAVCSSMLHASGWRLAVKTQPGTRRAYVGEDGQNLGTPPLQSRSSSAISSLHCAPRELQPQPLRPPRECQNSRPHSHDMTHRIDLPSQEDLSHAALPIRLTGQEGHPGS